VGGPRDAPERHQTLRATLTWSHDLLSTNERLLFRRLAVFANSGPYDAIDAVCNATGDLGGDVEEILAALIDHSLVRIYDTPTTGPRVRLLHTIREFAHEQLELSGEREAMHQAHAHWYAGMVIRTPSETWRTGTAAMRTWTLRHLPDTDNLSLAIEWLSEREHYETALRMVGGLVPFWLETGQLREGGEWTARLMPHVESAPADVQAIFYRMAAIMLFKDDTLDEANRLATQALALAEGIEQPRLIANCQNLLGQIRWRMGDSGDGERLQRAAIATLKDIDDPLGGALFASQIADSLIEAGDLERAEPLLREAIPVVERERPEAVPLLQGSMGYLAMQRGDLDMASHYLERSLDYHRPPPHRLPGALAGRLLTISELAARRGRFNEAAILMGAGEAICDRIGIAISQRDRDEVDGLLDKIRPDIGQAALDRDLATGRTLAIPDAISLALEITGLRSAASDSGENVAGGPDHDLTPREREVLGLLAEGMSNPAIAEALYISQRTVTTHLSRLYAKLDVSTRSEAIAHAVRMGLVTAQVERT
jgi:non-specific serine/threonine protein kinase